MDLSKVLEMLQANKLDETVQTEIKEKLEVIIEAKAQEKIDERVESEVATAKETLTEELEGKFETYKNDITGKFSNFVDSILDEEIQIPEKVMEYAKLGEMYQDLIEQFKVRLAIDEGALNTEVQNLLREAKEEIVSLKSDINESTGKVLDLEKDAQEMAAHIYLRKKCDGLTESQKSHVINILGDETVKESIDKKFGIIIESMDVQPIVKEEEDEGGDDGGDDKGDVKSYECKACGATAEVKEGGDTTCPECGEKMSLNEGKKELDEGKGHSEVDDDSTTQLDESVTLTPWDKQKEAWIQTLKG